MSLIEFLALWCTKSANDLNNVFLYTCLQISCTEAIRSQLDLQSSMFHYFSPESLGPVDHPPRRAKRLAARALTA